MQHPTANQLFPKPIRTVAFAFLLFCAFCLAAGSASAEPAGVRLPGHVPQAAISHAVLKGDVQPSQPIKVSFVLPLRNQAELNTLIQRLYNPKDPLYGHYLTPDEFTKEFGPTQADVNAVESYARSEGLSVVNVSSNHTLVEAQGPASTVNQALSVRLRWYTRGAGRPFYAPNADPLVPASIASKIVGIVGLDSARTMSPMFVRPANPALHPNIAPHVGNGPNNSGFTPSDIKKAYNLTATTLDGTGQSMAVYELDGYVAADIQTYESQYGLPSVPVQNVMIDGFNGVPTDPNNQTEVTLDIELSIALAPNITKLYVYEAPNSTQGSIDIINRIASDDLAKTVSISWGSPEDDPSQTPSSIYLAEQSALTQMAAQGQSVYVASGDNGAYDDLSEPSTLMVDDPGSQINATDVGGTTLSVRSDGTYQSETTWNGGNEIAGASGGGVSHLWSIPSYQSPVVAASANTELSPSMRNVPDVSLNADPNVGYSMYATLSGDPVDSGWQPIGGTSAGAPLWSGLTALINQERAANNEGPLGLADNALYSIAQGAGYHSDFHDIANNSNNFFYHAKAGLDLTTGLGSMNGGNLLADPLISGMDLNAAISGTVTNVLTSQPIAGVTITETLASSGLILQTTTTAADGTYTINAPANASLGMQASALSYYTALSPAVAPAANQTLTGFNFALLPSAITFSAGLQLVSSPYDYSGMPFAAIFSTPSTKAAVWMPSSGAYVLSPTAPADTFHLGSGYWINPQQPTSLDRPGTPAPIAPFSINLSAGWNMIGCPFTSAVPLANLTVTTSSGTVSYATAVSSGAVSALYVYSSGAYQTVDPGGSLTPWVGYWIMSSAPATLTVPNP